MLAAHDGSSSRLSCRSPFEASGRPESTDANVGRISQCMSPILLLVEEAVPLLRDLKALFRTLLPIVAP